MVKDVRPKDARRGLPAIPAVGEAKRGVDGYLTYLLRQAAGAVRLALDRALAAEGMTYAQSATLTLIRAYEPISSADLARLTLLTPQTVNGVVGTLETRGAIVKRPDAVHGRILRLEITPEGRALQKRCRALTAPIEARLNARLAKGAETAVRQWLVDVAKDCA